jgi:ssDNA-specific exonuclease RecJ
MFNIKRQNKSIIDTYFLCRETIYKVVHIFPEKENLVLVYWEDGMIKLMQTNITKKDYLVALNEGHYLKIASEEDVLQSELITYKWPHNVQIKENI